MSGKTNIPTHVAIIMDGNGRWAQERGQERIFGHMNGVESVRNAVKASLRNGVKYLTLYAFSTENWGRPTEEVEGLMDLFCKSVQDEAEELTKQGVRVRIMGCRDRMSDKVKEHFQRIEESTASGSNLTLILAINYSSKDEMTRAIRQIANEVQQGQTTIEDINQELIDKHLYTADYPDPDLIIRTSGECRLSNFLLWQAAYAELYFTPVLWPDFDEKCFNKAIESFGKRERRFGLVTK